jgi:flagellar biosynthesis protein FliQ
MNDTAVIEIALKMMIVVAKVTAPILIASLAVGLSISLFQSVTQIQEVTLTFVPKLAAVALVILIAGHWMLNEIVNFTQELFATLPRLLAG